MKSSLNRRKFKFPQILNLSNIIIIYVYSTSVALIDKYIQGSK